MNFEDIVINDKKIGKTTTTLPMDVKKYIRSQGYKINDLIRLGIKAKEGNPQLIERINRLENMYEIINHKLDILINNKRDSH